MVCSASVYKSTATACCGLLKVCAVKRGSFYMMGGEKKKELHVCSFVCFFLI